MVNVTEAELTAHAANAKGKVVIITGGANGLGKSSGTHFAKAGANVVIGDLDMVAAAQTVEEFKKFGGDAIAQRTDVTKWQDQLSLFQLAIKTYGRVDIVVANAGVGEIAEFDPFIETLKGAPSKPVLKTVTINEIGMIYTAKLALFYLTKSPTPLKSLIIIGSMASFTGIPMGPMYSTSKHAILGFVRSIAATAPKDIRVGMIAPWFAKTAIIDPEVGLILTGMPWVPVPRVGATVFFAATDDDPSTHGSAYVIPDDGNLWRVPRDELDSLSENMYSALRDRIVARTGGGNPAKA